MAIVYIADQGASICKRGDRLQIFKGPQLLRWFHTLDIEQLIIIGNIALTTQAATYLLKNRIDTVFLSYYGKYKGRLIGEFGKNVFLRVKQYKYLEDDANRNCLAQIYVNAKIDNMNHHLEKRLKRSKTPLIIDSYIKNKAIADKLASAAIPRDVIRGFEGIASKNYFAAFPDLLKNPNFSFNGRNRRPPRDEVNALLSLTYTLLMNQIMTATYISGLDPYVGALHEMVYGRQSLVLDLMEEFRPLIDNLVISLINRREIAPIHFKYNILPDDETESDDLDDDSKLLPVCLSQDGMKIVVTAFAKFINSKFTCTEPSGNWTLKDIFLNQARKLAALFENNNPYQPFLWR